jgi:hypothetical protein
MVEDLQGVDAAAIHLKDGEPAEDPAAFLTDTEEEDVVTADPSPVAVPYAGQDFDVAGLVRRLNADDILIPTFGHQDSRIVSAGFQRSFVWNRPQMDRFIESLLLGYPVPGIFLIRQKDLRYLVLDGQQRLRTLRDFFAGKHEGTDFVLDNVAVAFKGLTYESLPEHLRRQLEDTFFQATIVTTDGSSGSLDAIYQIFERVNSGGTQLTPHEIRVALFAGKYIDFLETLNRTTAWRTLYGPKSPRLRDQELVLRILAMRARSNHYSRPLKSFLNDYVGAHRQLEGINQARVKREFETAAGLLVEAGGRKFVRPESQLNAALTEGIMVGLLRRLASTASPSLVRLKRALSRLSSNEELIEVTTRATADEETVKRRLDIITRALAKV